MRLVGADIVVIPGAQQRSTTEGWSASVAVSSRPMDSQNAPSRQAANKYALARFGLSGFAWAVTSLAKAAAAPDTVRELNPSIVAATSTERTPYVYCVPPLRWGMPVRRWSVPVSPRQRKEQARIAAALGEIGFVLPGSLTERYFSCTHAGCHCHAAPPVLHGPYIQWSRKVAGKTTSRTLSPEQVADYQAWFDNERRLRALVHELEQLSLSILDADPRTPRRR